MPDSAPAARPILQEPHPLLRAISRPITPAELRGADMQAAIDAMFATVRANDLIGLAAPQIGLSVRLFVVDFTADGQRHGPIVVANPRLLRSDGEQTGEEATPCRPGQAWLVRRAARIDCRGLDRHGTPFTLRARGLLAVCVQHEIDHLDGILCFDRSIDR